MLTEQQIKHFQSFIVKRKNKETLSSPLVGSVSNRTGMECPINSKLYYKLNSTRKDFKETQKLMRKKKQTAIDKRILRAEYLRIIPEHRAMLLSEEIFESFDIHVGFIHQGVVSHVETIGTPEELGAHDAEKEIAIPRLSCFVVLVTQVTLHRINRLPSLFRQAVWETIDSIIDDEAEIPEILLVVINDCLEKAIMEINYKQLKDERIVQRLWNSIKSAYGERYAPNDSEVFDNFHESDEDDDEEE